MKFSLFFFDGDGASPRKNPYRLLLESARLRMRMDSPLFGLRNAIFMLLVDSILTRH